MIESKPHCKLVTNESGKMDGQKDGRTERQLLWKSRWKTTLWTSSKQIFPLQPSPNLSTVCIQHIAQVKKVPHTIQNSTILDVKTVFVNVNATNSISWQGHTDRVMQLNWLYFCGICQLIPLKLWSNRAQGCNHQSTCMPQLQPLCSAALLPNVLPRRDEGSGKPCALIEAS